MPPPLLSSFTSGIFAEELLLRMRLVRMREQERVHDQPLIAFTVSERKPMCRTQKYAYTLSSDAAAKETRDLLKALERRDRIRQNLGSVMEMASSLVRRV